METLTINTNIGTSQLLLGEKLSRLSHYLPDHVNIVIVTDQQIYDLYKDQFPVNVPVAVIGMGERNKTLQTAEQLYERFVAFNLDRSSFVVGIGGGIVCDVTGFVASTYMRGLRFGFVSSTLLAQVDASIGGKNGVNFQGYKNMIGVFNQPAFVILDFDLLKTLPEEEYIAAYAEIIKHAAIRNKNMFEFLEHHYEKALSHDKDVIHRMVRDSLEIKSDVVQHDEKEKGLRRILNFGHTVGHAIEKNQRMIHGQAVAVGMILAGRLSVKKGFLEEDAFLRLERLIHHFNLPVKTDLDRDVIIQSLVKDKKREGDVIHFVLLKGLGNAVVEPIPVEELKLLIHDLC